MPVQQKAINADTAMTRTDVVHLLQEVGNPEQLDVSNHDLRGINLMNGDLRGANLSQASVCEANLCGANLREADLREADLSWANLREADLREADLSWADLYGAFLGRADLRGTSLNKTYVRGADLSWACFGEASDSEQLKHRLWRRGAIFREKPRVRVAGRFSEWAGRHALGFALGFLLMSLVGLLCVLGIRVILTYMRLKRHPGDRTPRQVGTSPECRS